MKPLSLLRLLAATCALCLPHIARADRAAEPLFLRSTETEARLSAIQTSSVEYRPAEGEGPAIVLIGVAHLGTAEYYRAIQERLDAQTVVLFEGVGFDETTKQAPGEKTHDTGIQKQLSNALGLVFQLDAIDYRRPHFVNSDLPAKGVEEKIREHTDRPEAKVSKRSGPGKKKAKARAHSDPPEAPDDTYQLLMGAIQGRPETMEMLKPMLAFVSASPEMVETTRLLLIEMLSRAEEMVGFAKSISPEMKDLFDVLLVERNAVVLRDLRAQIAKHKAGETIAIFYGAAHMAELARRLRDDLHYTPGAEQWDTAFTADPAKSVVPPAQLKMILEMVRMRMKQKPVLQSK